MSWLVIVDSVDKTRALSEKRFFVNYHIEDDVSKDVILQNTVTFPLGTVATDVQTFFNDQISLFKSGFSEIDSISVGVIATL